MKHSEMNMSEGHSSEITDFRNATDYDFDFIASELWREYVFSDGSVVRIDLPRFLYVSKSGGHRIYDYERTSHYIPPGWIHLRWKAQDNQPHFVM